MTTTEKITRRLRAETEGVSLWRPMRAVIDVLIAALCVGLAMIPMFPAYGTQSVIVAAIAGVLCGTIPVLLGAFNRWPLPLTLVIACALYVVVGSAVAFGKELIGGIVPSGHSIAEMLTGIVTSWKEALTLEPPLGQSDGVLVLPFLVAFTGALITSLVVSWRRTWTSTIIAFVVIAVVLVVAILWGTQESVIGTYLGIGLFAVMMLWSSWRMKAWRPRRWFKFTAFLLVVLGVTAVVAPIVEPQNPRFVLRSVVVPPFDPRDQISPLSLYRAYVKDFENTPLVTVEGLPPGGTVRLATLDSYDGVVWSVSGDHSRAGSGGFRRIGERIDQTAQGEPYEVKITIEELEGVWTPTVGYLSAVRFDNQSMNDFRFNDSTGAAVIIGGVKQGASYELRGVLPESPSDEELGEAGVGKISIADATNIPDVITQEAISMSRDAANVPLVLRKYEEYLQTRGFFSHGEATGGYPSVSGHGSARMADLFSADLMVGDAEQYASAMALLARTQGVPSRVVMGFVPEDDRSEVTFTGGDMTAWVEIFYEGYGWVSYFPTPPESQTPQASEQESEPEPEPEAIQLPPDPQPPVTPPAVNSEETNVDTDDNRTEEDINWAAIAKTIAVVGLPLIVLFSIPAAIVLRKVLRRKRRRQAPPAQSVVGGWQEIVDHALDLGIRPQEDFTRRETARFIEAGNPGTGLRKLAEVADRAHFSADEWAASEADEYWAQIHAGREALDRTVPLRRRILAKVSLASLRAQKRREASETKERVEAVS